jgi:hypothetical protein
MQFQLAINIPAPDQKINYRQKILLTGSCFTEHIGNALADAKFSILQNPNGILFDPVSVCNSLVSYIHNKQYTVEELFLLNEVWNSWHHHSRYSNISKDEAKKKINESQQAAHDFLKHADWLIITLGSSFSYRLTELANNKTGEGVANCHRAPAQWFNKHLLTIREIIESLDNCIHQLFQFNPQLKILFTISPVRHIRDGVVENNRSKARLIESVHHMVSKFENLYYFPAYEIVIDVLRDYRFYDIDMVHPNYPATEFVMEKFVEAFIQEDDAALMQEIKKIVIARRHKAFQPDTNAHKQFLRSHYEKVKLIQEKYPYLNFEEELNYFNS